MKKNKFCPKCKNSKIIIIKDIFHSNGGGNITKSKNIFNNRNCAKLTFYICEECGYVEQYLDKDEINKLKS